MSHLLQFAGAFSLILFCALGVLAVVAAFAYTFSGRGAHADEWEERESSETERSVTVEEFVLVQPRAETGDELPRLESTPVRRTITKSVVKVESFSRPRGLA